MLTVKNDGTRGGNRKNKKKLIKKVSFSEKAGEEKGMKDSREDIIPKERGSRHSG